MDFDCKTCGGVCDLHCMRCGADVFTDGIPSVSVVKWHPEQQANTLAGMLCTACWVRVSNYILGFAPGSQVKHTASGYVYTVAGQKRRFGTNGVYVVDNGAKRWIPLGVLIPVEPR